MVIPMARPVDPHTVPALLGSASKLLYRHGVAATGVADVADAAGVTKQTLYRHFSSKQALVTAYLDARHRWLTNELASRVESTPAASRPWAVIEWLTDSLSEPDFNGCAFVRTYAELPGEAWAHERAQERKQTMLEAINGACTAAGVADPDELARQLALIVEGATTMAFVTGDAAAAAESARQLARTALQAAGLEV